MSIIDEETRIPRKRTCKTFKLAILCCIKKFIIENLIFSKNIKEKNYNGFMKKSILRDQAGDNYQLI